MKVYQRTIKYLYFLKENNKECFFFLLCVYVRKLFFISLANDSVLHTTHQKPHFNSRLLYSKIIKKKFLNLVWKMQVCFIYATGSTIFIINRLTDRLTATRLTDLSLRIRTNESSSVFLNRLLISVHNGGKNNRDMIR